jgi:hypothetical protein
MHQRASNCWPVHGVVNPSFDDIMAARIFVGLTFFAVVMNFIHGLMAMVGIPKALSPVREVALVVLLLIALKRSDVFKSRAFFITVLLYVFLLIVNIGLAAVQDRHMAGLYYTRNYMHLAICMITVQGLIAKASPDQLAGLIRMVFWSGLAIIASAFVIFVWIEIDPQLLYTIMGTNTTGTGTSGQDVLSAWRIAGGAWLRMGMPTISPNALGLFIVFYLLFMIPVIIEGRYFKLSTSTKMLMFSLTLIALVMTFSRSGWVALLLGLGVMLCVCGQQWGIATVNGLFKLLGVLLAVLMFFAVSVLAVDMYSDGLISGWFNLTSKGADPSMEGHAQTFVDAIEFVDRYFWRGYPKGTVGGHALLFGTEMHNAENSFISIFYEMGVPLGLVFWVLMAFMLRGLWIHRVQWAMLSAFTFSNMVLPYVFEPDVIALFLILMVLSGRMMQCAQQDRLHLMAQPNEAPPPLSKLTSRTAFSSTVFDPM